MNHNREMITNAYKNASEEERKKACESLGVPYIPVGDEKINEPDMNVQEARFWLASEAHRLGNVECLQDIVKIYGRPMTEEEARSWAKVTTAAIRVILRAAGLSDDWHKKPRKKVTAIDLTPELEEKIMPLREHEDFKGCSMSEILRRLLLKGLEKEG